MNVTSTPGHETISGMRIVDCEHMQLNTKKFRGRKRLLYTKVSLLCRYINLQPMKYTKNVKKYAILTVKILV